MTQERTAEEEVEWLLELVKRANTLLIDASCLNGQAPGMNQDSEWFAHFQLWTGMAARSLKKVTDVHHTT